MGLVQSQAQKLDDAVEIDGLFFTVEQSLKRLIPTYGNLVIDFRNSYLGEKFSVRFSRQGSC